MMNCPLCEKASAYREFTTSHLQPVCDSAKRGGRNLQKWALEQASDPVVTERCLLKASMISFGILIGCSFSDFFKKHRSLFLFFAFAMSAALFIYRLYLLFGEWDDNTEDF